MHAAGRAQGDPSALATLRVAGAPNLRGLRNSEALHPWHPARRRSATPGLRRSAGRPQVRRDLDGSPPRPPGSAV